jgi:hypothetical protein
VISEDAIKQLRRLMELRTKRDEDKKAAEESEKAYRDAEADVYEALADGPMERLNNIDLGEPWGKVSFHAKETIYGNVIDEEKLMEYFEQRAMVEEVTEPKFSKARLNEVARDCVEQASPFPPGLDFHPRRYVQITRKKGE